MGPQVGSLNGVDTSVAAYAGSLAGLRPEDRLLLLCARRRFAPGHRSAVVDVCTAETLCWDHVCSAAIDQGVAPLIYGNLLQCGLPELRIPRAVVDRFRRYLGRSLATKHTMALQLVQALLALRAQSLEVMLIKGAALDYLVYGGQALTVSQDLDLVLRVHKDELGPETLAAVHRIRRGYPLEYDFYEHHDLTLNGALPVDFDRIWREAVPIRYGGQPAWVMRPEDLLIAACINACRKRFAHLKALVDLAEVLGAFPDLDWTGVAERTRADECGSIVYAALLVVRRLLGVSVPEASFNSLLVKPARAAAIRWLIRGVYPISWTVPHGRLRVFHRDLNLSLLLPYVTYSWGQVQRKLHFVWRSRESVHSA